MARASADQARIHELVDTNAQLELRNARPPTKPEWPFKAKTPLGAHPVNTGGV